MPFRSAEAGYAYCAGLFEGEGTITHRSKHFRTRSGEKRPRKTPQFGLCIGMTDLEPLELWRDAMALGKIYGPYADRTHFKPTWKLEVCALGDIREACRLMWPYLSPRRQARITELVGDPNPLSV